MKDQHEKIKGFRDLTEEEIFNMNTAKSLAEQVGLLIDSLDSVGGIDQRWLAIAKTDLQKGFMALVRSIAQPTTF